MFSLRGHFIDFAMIASRNIEIARLIQSKIPDILRAWREILRRTPGRIERRLGVFRRVCLAVGLCRVTLLTWLVFDLVHLAIRCRSRVDHAPSADFERLYLQFLWLEDDCRFTVGSDAVHTRRR